MIITGAAGRLGKRMAERFRDAGYDVAGVGRRCAWEADLTAEQEVSRVFDEIERRHGPLYALVHTVGMWASSPLGDTNLADWKQMLDVNLTSTFLCFREAARRMGPAGGRLIAITAAQGADRGRSRQAAYAAAKAGVVRLVEAAAEEYHTRGITAHALAPSMIVYDGRRGSGVPAADLVQAALFLCGKGGASANGTTWRMYGSRPGR